MVCLVNVVVLTCGVVVVLVFIEFTKIVNIERARMQKSSR
jgi:aromatic ring-opening dioxygenase LigB subunit